MRLEDFLIKMFTARSGLSSKRVCGFIGWIVCLFICIWCTITVTAAPEIIELLFLCSAALLGVDTVASIWRKENKTNENEKTIC